MTRPHFHAWRFGIILVQSLGQLPTSSVLLMCLPTTPINLSGNNHCMHVLPVSCEVLSGYELSMDSPDPSTIGRGIGNTSGVGGY